MCVGETLGFTTCKRVISYCPVTAIVLDAGTPDNVRSTDAEYFAYQMKYDSVHGKFKHAAWTEEAFGDLGQNLDVYTVKQRWLTMDSKGQTTDSTKQ